MRSIRLLSFPSLHPILLILFILTSFSILILIIMPSPSTLLVTSLAALSGVSSYVLPASFQNKDVSFADPFHKASPHSSNSSATSARRSPGTSFKVPLKRYNGKGSNAKRDLTGDELMAWANRQGDLIRHKYSKGEARRQFLEEQQLKKRQTIGLTDVGADR